MRPLILIALVVALLANPAVAHHNMSATFDTDARFTLTGTLTKIDWRNPHISLTVESKTPAGATQAWEIEGPSPSLFRSYNLGKADVERSFGKTISVEISPARDKSLFGLLRVLTLSDGRVMGLCPQHC